MEYPINSSVEALQHRTRIKESVDWRQKVPLYGIFKMHKDRKEGKPTLLDKLDNIIGDRDMATLLLSWYHVAPTVAVLGILYESLK